MLDMQVNTRRLELALDEFAQLSRRDLRDVMRQQAGIIVGHVIAVTPPGAAKGQAMTEQGGIAISAKKRGESVIAADIARIFPTTRLNEDAAKELVSQGFEWRVGRGQRAIVRKTAFSVAELETIHRQARSRSTGRTRKGKGANMALTRKAILRQFIREKQKSVGKLNSGWLAAARELKTSSRAVPAWIRRHGVGPGGTDTSDRRGDVTVTVFNGQDWFPGNMDARLDLAIKRRERGIRKAIEAMLERNARRATRRMGR